MSPKVPKLRRRRRVRKGPSIREQVWNLPNFLTYCRIGLIPVVMYFMSECVPGPEQGVDYASRLNSFIATAIFAAAAITDFFDGWIARNFNLSTMVGRFLDPLADKLLVMACLVMCVQLDRVPAWFAILLISRELSITSLRSIATQEGLEVRVAQSGKWKTAFQMIGLLGVMMFYTYPIEYFGVVTHDLDFGKVGFFLLALSMAFSLFSAAVYFGRFATAAAVHAHDDPAD